MNTQIAIQEREQERELLQRLYIPMVTSLEDVDGSYVSINHLVRPSEDYGDKKGSFSDEERLQEVERVGRTFMVSNRLVLGYNDAEIIHSSIRQPWEQTAAYEIVLSHRNLMIGAVGYHSANPFSRGLLDGRPNIEWAVQNPSTSLTKKPFDELDDETILKYILYKLRRHDMPF